MKMSSAMAMLLRSPVKTLVTAVLIAAVTFGFFSQIFEYMTLSQEMAHLADLYRITGTVEASASPAHETGAPFELLAQVADKLRWMTRRFDMDTPEGVAEFHDFTIPYDALSPNVMEGIAASPHVRATSTHYMTAGVGEYYRIDGNDYYYNYMGRVVMEGIVEHERVIHYSLDIPSRMQLTLSDCKLLAGDPTNFPSGAVNKRIMVQFDL